MGDDFTPEELKWFAELDDISKTFDRIFAKIKANKEEMDSRRQQRESTSKEHLDVWNPKSSNSG